MAQRILLTGANGFLGSHILDQLLARGHNVRAIVRSQAKAERVKSDFPGNGSCLDFGIVPEIAAPGAFDQAVKSTPPFDFVIHTASPFLYSAVSCNKEFLDPAIRGTIEILESIKAYAPRVKRVVITSSIAAVLDFSQMTPSAPKKIYTEDDWNPVTLDEALIGTRNTGYQASKTFAEKAAWNFVRNEKPNFDLVTLTPPMIYGPIRHTINSPKSLNESNLRIYNLFINSKKEYALPSNGMHVYTDVRDLAFAHIQAIFVAEASGQRFIICAGQLSSQQISDTLRKGIPGLKEITPEGTPGENSLPENAYSCSSEKAEKVLRIEFRSREETFVDLAKQLLQIESLK